MAGARNLMESQCFKSHKSNFDYSDFMSTLVKVSPASAHKFTTQKPANIAATPTAVLFFESTFLR
jgi:hypothetical protein